MERSVDPKVFIVNKNEKNINMSLILESTNVLRAALIVYIRVE